MSQLRTLSECEKVAAVCYRLRSGGIEFLLVRTRAGKRWTFPKGSAEPGLTHAQAAALEAFEEAGVHGRIEEASFTRYVRRQRGPVKAHLCEVLRLSDPKEPKRRPTWFSVGEAKKRLAEGRTTRAGAEFARVVDKALARIHRTQSGDGIAGDRPQEARSQRYLPQWNAGPPQRNGGQRDGLQKVQFDFAEAYGRGAPFTRHVDRQLGAVRQSIMTAGARDPEVLQCEVLEFDPEREIHRNPRWLSAGKKINVLGSGKKIG